VGTGIRSETEDLVVIVSVRPQSGVLGYAFTCGYEQEFNRPVVGVLNLNPRYIDTADIVTTARHELLHLLGFSPSAYSRYIDESGNTLGLTSVVGSESRTFNGQTVNVNKIITPRVTAHARSYFGCDNVDGVELEESGGSGSAGAHWEARILNNELMTASNSFTAFTDEGILSNFTLALLEDSGWYRVNPDFEVVNGLIWGKDAGCDFVNNRCEDWNLDREGYFCDTNTDSEGNTIERCNFDLTTISTCFIQDYQTNLGYYAHLPNPSLGGINFYDYCPLVVRFSNGDCRSTTTSVSQQRNGVYGQYFGEEAACFNSNAAPSSAGRASQAASCYRTTCDNGVLGIVIGDETITCPSDQSASRITTGLPSGYTGYVECPERGFDIICGRSSRSASPAPGPGPAPAPTPATSVEQQPDESTPTGNAPATTAVNILLFAVLLVMLAVL